MFGTAGKRLYGKHSMQLLICCNVQEILKRKCTQGKQYTKLHNFLQMQQDESNVKAGYLKVLISTGEYYEETLRDGN